MFGEISRVGVGLTCTMPRRQFSVPTYHQTGKETVSERPLSSPFPPPPPPGARDGIVQGRAADEEGAEGQHHEKLAVDPDAAS